MSHGRPRPSVKDLGKTAYPYVPYPVAQGSHETTKTNMGEMQKVVPNGDWFAQYEICARQDSANPARRRLQSLRCAPGQQTGQDQFRASPVIFPSHIGVLDLPLPSGGASIPFSTNPDLHSELPLPLPYNIERPPPPEVYDTLRPGTATEYRFNKYNADNDETHKPLSAPPARPSDEMIRRALEQKIDKKELQNREKKNAAIIRDMERGGRRMGSLYPPPNSSWR
jgi:hypothetical protein